MLALVPRHYIFFVRFNTFLTIGCSCTLSAVFIQHYGLAHELNFFSFAGDASAEVV